MFSLATAHTAFADGQLADPALRERFEKNVLAFLSLAEAAKYYSVAVDVCPSRRGWRKGVVEKANHAAAQRWFTAHGGSAANDVAGLDGNHDGTACQDLP